MKVAFLAVALSILTTPVLACQWDTDCQYPSKCIKERGKIQGVCVKR